MEKHFAENVTINRSWSSLISVCVCVCVYGFHLCSMAFLFFHLWVHIRIVQSLKCGPLVSLKWNSIYFTNHFCRSNFDLGYQNKGLHCIIIIYIFYVYINGVVAPLTHDESPRSSFMKGPLSIEHTLNVFKKKNEQIRFDAQTIANNTVIMTTGPNSDATSDSYFWGCSMFCFILSSDIRLQVFIDFSKSVNEFCVKPHCYRANLFSPKIRSIQTHTSHNNLIM